MKKKTEITAPQQKETEEYLIMNFSSLNLITNYFTLAISSALQYCDKFFNKISLCSVSRHKVSKNFSKSFSEIHKNSPKNISISGALHNSG